MSSNTTISFPAKGDRGRDFRVQHQVTAVADQDNNLSFRFGQLHAQSAGDLVAHAGVSVFDMVSVLVAGPPELVKFAGKAARGADDHRVFFERLVDGAKNVGIGWQIAFLFRYGLCYGTGPCTAKTSHLFDPIGRKVRVVQTSAEQFQCAQGV